MVDVTLTSTEEMNEAFKEEDEKYRVWTTHETKETIVAKAVMVPLIISHHRAVHGEP